MAKNELEKLEEERIQRYKNLFLSEDGQWVLRDLLQRSFIFNSTLSTDPYITYRNEGRREFVLDILKRVKLTPETLILFTYEEHSIDEKDILESDLFDDADI